MATLNKQFYQQCNDALYSDGAIENEMYNRICEKDDTIYSDDDWTVFYHFSPLRQNILNWYPFEKEASLLEIGAGCGALTGMLTERVDKVTACELTLRRASIIYERYKEKDNLEVIVGNFLKVSFDKKFDYIVINGVLEYSKMIMETDSEDAFKMFLECAKNLLEPNGKILLAIENRIGLKYLSGAPEDHTGRIFDGINGYSKEGREVRTFSKDELKNLCDAADLKVNTWFYPYPDYKFATEIFTDSSVNSIFPSSYDIPYDLPRAGLYDQGALYGTLMKNQMADVFSNSFLLELCNDTGVDKTGIDYVKISNNRNKEFCIYTTISDGYACVTKQPLYQEGKAHLEKMTCAKEFHPMLRLIESDYKEECLQMPFVKGKTMRKYLEELAANNETDEIWRFLGLFREGFYSDLPLKKEPSMEFTKIFGDLTCNQELHWVSGVEVDLIADNIFLTEDKWTYIDNEWTFDFEIPAEYVLWRTLSQLCDSSLLGNIITPESIDEFINISENTASVFVAWEQHFVSDYVGIRDLSPIYKPVYNVDLHEVIEKIKESQTITSHLFVFDSKNNVKVLENNAVLKDGVWQVTFEDELISSASQIRWDPLEGSSCEIYNVYSDGISFTPCNAVSEKEPFVFETYDPQFMLSGRVKTNIVVIKFSCELTDWTTGYFNKETEILNKQKLIDELDQKIQEKLNENQALENSNQVLENNNQALQSENQALENSNQVLENNNQVLQSENQALENNNQVLRNENQELQSENQTLENNNQVLQNENQTLQSNNQILQGEIESLRDYVQNHRFKAIIRIILKKFM